METTLLPRGDSTFEPARRRSMHRKEHAFFLAAAAVAATLIAAGFGRALAAAPVRPRTPLVLVHAAVFASRVLLFIAQTTLVATGRTRIHRRLGVFGAVLAIVMLALGFAVAIQAARTGYAPVPGVDALAFLIVPFGDLLVFAPLVGAALYWRDTPAIHKRLMWLATVMLMFPAVTRLPGVQGNRLAIVGCFAALALMAPVYERVVRGRMHPVSLWGGLAVFASVPVRRAIGSTELWHAFAAWLIL